MTEPTSVTAPPTEYLVELRDIDGRAVYRHRFPIGGELRFAPSLAVTPHFTLGVLSITLERD